MSLTFLEKVIEMTRAELKAMKHDADIDALRERACNARQAISDSRFRDALGHTNRLNIIAEIKRSSPSRGIINDSVDVRKLARDYEAGGAAAISVLTENDYFGGSLDDLRAVRSDVDLPVLRKDFIVDEYQIYEAAEAGADAVLLIVAALREQDLNELLALVQALNMAALVEVHAVDEMKTAAAAGAEIIGINNRDLHSLEVSLDVSRKLIRERPHGALMVAESGLSTKAEIDELRGLGFDGFLIGETLMRSGNVRNSGRLDLNKPHLRYKKQTPRQRTWTIHLIALEKIVKGTVLIVVAFKLLTLFDRDVHAWAADFVTRHGIDIANRYVQTGLERLVGVGNTQLVELSVVALLYAVLLFAEGIGLWLQKRWAEYLTAISTSLLIPLEIYEIYARFTSVRIAILVLNLFIVWYLVTRLKDEEQGSPILPVKPVTPRIKICGISNLEDAESAVELGADELGFNFYPKSLRYVTPEMAHEIIRHLDASVWKVGVFVNETQERILEIVKMVGLDAIQLHGDEDHDFVTRLHRSTDKEVIKAVGADPELDLAYVVDFDADAILLDNPSKEGYGGSGKQFDWQIAKDVSTKVGCVYLAGGLSSKNVGEAIQEVRPYAVDACSLLETSPGKKDRDKVAAFIKAAKEAI